MSRMQNGPKSHYSYRKIKGSQLAIYIISSILIVGLFVFGAYDRWWRKPVLIPVISPTQVIVNAKQAPLKIISVYFHDTNKILKMELDEYIIGTVSGEMPASYNIEALKAQAIACRTLAYKKLGLSSSCKGADICSASYHNQGFSTYEDRLEKWGDDYTKWQTKIEDAVYDTRGIVISYQGEVIDVFYHAASSGKTENSVEVFTSQKPYLKSVESFDKGLVTDNISYKKSEFIKLINKIFDDAILTSKELEQQVFVHSKTDSGRVDLVRLGGTLINGVDFRKALGLKSTDFTINVGEDYVSIYTDGYGHGVGMSQQGANAMAKNGYTYSEILQHYFNGITLDKIY